MFGDLIKDVAEITGTVIGTVGGIAIAPIAITLDVSEGMVREAVNAGCETIEEIRDFLGV